MLHSFNVYDVTQGMRMLSLREFVIGNVFYSITMSLVPKVNYNPALDDLVHSSLAGESDGKLEWIPYSEVTHPHTLKSD